MQSSDLSHLSQISFLLSSLSSRVPSLITLQPLALSPLIPIPRYTYNDWPSSFLPPAWDLTYPTSQLEWRSEKPTSIHLSHWCNLQKRWWISLFELGIGLRVCKEQSRFPAIFNFSAIVYLPSPLVYIPLESEIFYWVQFCHQNFGFEQRRFPLYSFVCLLPP